MGPFTLRLVDKSLYHKIILATLWISIYVPVTTTASHGAGKAEGDNTCNATECKEMAAMIRRQMGKKSPCFDFHNYVCKKWKGDRELKPVLLKKKAVTTLMYLLGNASTPPLKDLNATQKLVLAYNSCTTEGRDKEALKTSVNKVLAQYNLVNGTWPIFEEGSSLSKDVTYQDILKRAGPRPVFFYSVSREQEEPIILMSKPSDFYMSMTPDFSSRKADDTEEALQEYSYSDYEGLDARDEESYKIFIAKAIVLLNASVTEENARKIAEAIVAFEKNLSNLASEATTSSEERMSLSQLSEKMPGNFPMTDILKKDFEGLNISISGATMVLVKYLDYYTSAAVFISCSKTADLINYILWRKIRSMAQAEGTLLNDIYLEYKRNTSLNLTGEEHTPRGNITLLCALQLLQTDIMYTAGATYYIKAKFDRSSKGEVLKIFKLINSSFKYFVTNNTWMTDRTKEAAIIKLEKVDAVIGYPDWMLNDTIINYLYRFIPPIQYGASFVEHFHYLQENNNKQNLLMLDATAYFKKTHEDAPLRSHAYYVEHIDTLVYPAAALVTHYRRPPIPRSVNFGTIGTVLAQLLSNLMDRYDYAFKGTQRYNKDTWDNVTRDGFCNRSTCLNNTVECNDTSSQPTSRLEDLLDYLGIRISYHAMNTSKNNYTGPFLLPDKKNRFDSESKIFFTLFGSLYCPYSVNQNGVESRADDHEHEFSERLNEIVHTDKDFNSTFGCLETGADTCQLVPADAVPNLPNC